MRFCIPNEKLGWKERDANQIKDFHDVLSRCGLVDLGFMGQKFTWCNGRHGEQRMLPNKAWFQLFPEAKVFHILMSARIIFGWPCP